MKRSHLLLAICALLAVAVTASVAAAATEKKRSKRAQGPKAGMRFKLAGEGPKALAKKLGVSVNELRSALEAARKSVGPPDHSAHKDSQARETQCLKVAAAVAERLDITVDSLTRAAKDVAKERLAKDVAAKRLSQSQADAMSAKIDASKCAPLGGPPRGCAGIGGRGAPAGPDGGRNGPRGPEGQDGPSNEQQANPTGSES